MKMDPGIQYLLEASVKLGCSRSTKIRAMILYHHFMRCVDEVKYDVAMVAAAALNLSSKIGEEIIDLDTIVLLFYCIVKKTDEVLDSDDTSFILLRKSLITVDFIMQRMLEFTLNHQLAHQYMLPFLELVFARSFKIASHHQAMSDACLSLMTDFYTNKKCLNYNPEHIAVACIDAAMHIFKLEKHTEMINPWYEGLCSDLTPEKLKEIKHDVFLVYEVDKEDVSQTKALSEQQSVYHKEDAAKPKAPSEQQPVYSMEEDLPQPKPPSEQQSVYNIGDAAQPKPPSEQQSVYDIEDATQPINKVPSEQLPIEAVDNSDVVMKLKKDNMKKDKKEITPPKIIEEIVLD